MAVEVDVMAPANPAVVAEVQGSDEPKTSTAVVPRDQRSLELGSMGGDVKSSDLRLPRLQIAYGVGKLATNYSQGDLVLDGEHLIVAKRVPVKVIVWSTYTYWKEYLDNEAYNAGLRTRTFASAEEVKAAGGTTDWGPSGERPTFSRAIDLRLFIQKPEKLECGLFGIDLDGKPYAPAMFTADKMGFGKIQPAIQTAATFSLRKRGLQAGMWELSTEVKVEGAKTKVFPLIKLIGFNSPKLLEDLKTVFDGGEPEAPAAS